MSKGSAEAWGETGWKVLATSYAGEWESQVVSAPKDDGARWRLVRYDKRGQVVETRVSRSVYWWPVLDVLDEAEKHRGRIPWRQ